MKRQCQPIWPMYLGLVLVLTGSSLTIPDVLANTSECTDGTPVSHTFSSGASWSLCMQVSETHGLQLNNVLYQAPGDRLRSVLESLHAAQILMHYHDEPEERPQLGYSDVVGRVLPMNSSTCDGELLMEREAAHDVCSRIEDNRILAKYAQRPALQSERWELTSTLQRDMLTLATSVNLTEDGQIIPAISLSGRARQSSAGGFFASTLPESNQSLARATVLSTWRIVFNLDDGATDAVEQLDFPLITSQGNQRPMQITPLDTELFANVVREQFRGWRIMDPVRGSGYYLDPSNSGFSFTGSENNWAGFDVALTRFDACERYAMANLETDDVSGTSDSAGGAGETGETGETGERSSANAFVANARNDACGNSLDDFVNGESLQDAHPVLWYSQSRTLNPSDEHWPVIRSFYQSFNLQPFDWTQASPFEVLQ